VITVAQSVYHALIDSTSQQETVNDPTIAEDPAALCALTSVAAVLRSTSHKPRLADLFAAPNYSWNSVTQRPRWLRTR